MANLVLDPAASADIDQLAAWLCEQATSRAKLNFLADLAQVATSLAAFPEMGRASLRQADIRELIFGRHYKLYYNYAKAHDEVRVLAVVDTRRDPGRRPGGSE